MTLLRLFAFVFLIILVVYTGIVMVNHGANLIPIFFGDMAAMTWPGQFNLDFFGFLILSAMWIGWRHNYSAIGWALIPLALFGGMLFLTIYLLIQSFRMKGDLKSLLIGEQRAAA